jgi:CBS-domain-containing membrane protein
LSREYAIDPLEILFVREVMRTTIAALPAQAGSSRSLIRCTAIHHRRRQRLYPIVDDSRTLLGVATRNDLTEARRRLQRGAGAPTRIDHASGSRGCASRRIVAMVVYRMAETGLTRFPVVERRTHALVGMIRAHRPAQGARLTLDAEHRRERVLGTRITMPFRERRSLAEKISVM